MEAFPAAEASGTNGNRNARPSWMKFPNASCLGHDFPLFDLPV